MKETPPSVKRQERFCSCAYYTVTSPTAPTNHNAEITLISITREKYEFRNHSRLIPRVHSKNSGMTFIPKEYDVHTRRFHTHGMNSASMTFILFRSMRFIPRMRKYVRHTESRYELHTALYTDAESMTFIPNRGMNFTPRYLQIQGV